MQIQILGVPISVDGRDRVLEKVRSFLREARFHRIATVNPEFLVLASRDNSFRKNILAADLRVADGFGMVLAGLLQGEEVPRFPGVDLMHDILSLAEKEEYSVFLAIREDGLSSYDEIRTALLQKYPKLAVSGPDDELGNIENLSADEAGWKLPARGRGTRPGEIKNSTIVLCNFGAPEQELFLESLRNTPGDVRLVMGVGGSFDFLTGRQKRAPKWLRAFGLEWLWRLVLQPKRFKRIWNAVVIFPIKVLFSRNSV